MTGDTAIVLFAWALLAIGFTMLARSYRNWARRVDETLNLVEEIPIESIAEIGTLDIDRIDGWIAAVWKEERRDKSHSSTILFIGIDGHDRTMKVVDLNKGEFFSIETKQVRAHRYPMRYFILVVRGLNRSTLSLKQTDHGSSIVVRCEGLNRLREILGQPAASKRGFYWSSQRLDP